MISGGLWNGLAGFSLVYFAAYIVSMFCYYLLFTGILLGSQGTGNNMCSILPHLIKNTFVDTIHHSSLIFAFLFPWIVNGIYVSGHYKVAFCVRVSLRHIYDYSVLYISTFFPLFFTSLRNFSLNFL